MRKVAASLDLPVRPSKRAPCGALLLGGEGEIRTRGELPHDGFQDRYLKPLGHLSVDAFGNYIRDVAVFLASDATAQTRIPRLRPRHEVQGSHTGV